MILNLCKSNCHFGQNPNIASLLTAIFSLFTANLHAELLHWSWQHTKALGAECAETIGSLDSCSSVALLDGGFRGFGSPCAG